MKSGTSFSCFLPPPPLPTPLASHAFKLASFTVTIKRQQISPVIKGHRFMKTFRGWKVTSQTASVWKRKEPSPPHRTTCCSGKCTQIAKACPFATEPYSSGYKPSARLPNGGLTRLVCRNWLHGSMRCCRADLSYHFKRGKCR